MQGVWNLRTHIYSKVTGTAKRSYKLHFISKLQAIILKKSCSPNYQVVHGVCDETLQSIEQLAMLKTVPEISQWYTNLNKWC